MAKVLNFFQASFQEFFSGFFTQLHKLRSLRRSFLHFQNSMTWGRLLFFQRANATPLIRVCLQMNPPLVLNLTLPSVPIQLNQFIIIHKNQ